MIEKYYYRGYLLEIEKIYNKHTSKYLYFGSSKEIEFHRLRTDAMFIVETFIREVDLYIIGLLLGSLTSKKKSGLTSLIELTEELGLYEYF